MLFKTSQKVKPLHDVFVLRIDWTAFDASCSTEIHIPKESIHCRRLQDGLITLYTALYSTEWKKADTCNYAHVAGYAALLGEDSEESSAEPAECDCSHHFELCIARPRYPVESPVETWEYHLNKLSWRFHDAQGFIEQVQIEWTSEEINQVCAGIRQAHVKMSAGHFHPDLLHFENHNDPKEFYETAKPFFR